MDNAKVMEKISFLAINQYVTGLIKSKIRKLTLFPAFPNSSMVNLTCPVHFVLTSDLNAFMRDNRFSNN